MLNGVRLLSAVILSLLAGVPLRAQDRYAVDWQAVWNGGNAPFSVKSDGRESGGGGRHDEIAYAETDFLRVAAYEGMEISGSGGMSDWCFERACASAKTKQPAVDTTPRPKNKLTAKEWRKTLTFAERNSGAFRSRKHGGVRSPGMAALCSAVVPGLGQFYNAQWYKPPVIYAGAVVIGYFIDFNLREKRIYEREIDKRYYNADASIRNPDLAGTDNEELLRLRNYYEQNFELTLIIAGAVYLLNIIDAVVYAHLFDFNVTPNLSLRLEPYAAPNFVRDSRMSPWDMGFRLCMNF